MVVCYSVFENSCFSFFTSIFGGSQLISQKSVLFMFLDNNKVTRNNVAPFGYGVLRIQWKINSGAFLRKYITA